MRYGISRFFLSMSYNESQILDRVLNAIDSDDIQEIAMYAESNLTKVQLDVLQKMLNTTFQEKKETSDCIHNIKQFLYFIE